MRLPALAAATLLAVTSCARRPPSATAQLEEAADAATDAKASPRTLALAGFHAWLVKADVEQAQVRFDDAVARSSAAEPWALLGQLLLARRHGDPKALSIALDLCERAPTHPLASVAARMALDLAGTAVPLDELILTRGQKALDAGALGDTAQLLRSGAATILGQRSDNAGQAATLAAMGVPTRFSVLGPFSAFQLLAFDDALGPEKDGSLAGPFVGPYGAVTARTLTFPDGRLNLAAEPSEGDVYLLAVDLEVAKEGLHVLRSVTAAPHKVYLDGELVLHKRSFERSGSTVQAQGVQLTAGKHRVLVKLVKDDRSGSISVAAMRADGKPAELTFSPASGPAPAPWKATGAAVKPAPGVYADAAQLAAALESEAGLALAQWVAVRDGMGRDRDGAKRLMDALSSALTTPAVTGLRAELSQGDRTVPAKVSKGRATRDVEATLEKDKGNVEAMLLGAALALEDSRLPEATELVKRARAAHSPPSYLLPLLQARIELALGIDAQAEQSALEALKLQPGLCEADGLRYDLARRRDAVALADQLVGTLARCPGALARAAEHAKGRGQLKEAAERFGQLVERDSSNAGAATSLSQVLVALKRYPEAVEVLKKLLTIWPRSAVIYKRLGDVQEMMGDKAAALKTREQALLLDGGDLPLRRAVERARTGKELLADYAIDGKAAISAYEQTHADEEATGAYVLDAAAIQAFPDGSMVDRIHIIQKALDQSGISELAEVSLPQGAQVLSLRTVKPDGTVLEPESFEGKETISLPGVQVGDYVEYEYLQAHPPRGLAQPGFTASAFYYQIARLPNSWSTYTVIAPKGAGMGVDAHNLPPSEQVRVEKDREVFFHEERRVPPYIPEPDSPPSGNEYLPFVSVGAGATGNDGLISAYGDAYLDRGQLTFEVEQFARGAVGDKKGLDAVRALYAAVMEKLSGRDAGLSQSAASSLAQDRGSRLWALKASLEALGIPTRLVAVRTFSVDPAAYRYPNEALLPYVCLRTVVDGQTVWMDPLVRYAPFGELPEQAAGGRDAWLLPEPGRPMEKVQTPPRAQVGGKTVTLKLKLSADGKLAGSGEEVYAGLEAAQLIEALEALSPDQRSQALQSALSRYFGGADLSNLRLDFKREVGGSLAVRYDFTASRYARVEGDGKLVLGALTFPAYLGRRYVQVGSRRTPLFIDATEQSQTRVTLELPSGYKLNAPAAEVKAQSPYGRFIRKEKQQGNTVEVEESYQLDMARIPPKQYPAFAQFAGEVDLLQARDLLVEKK